MVENRQLKMDGRSQRAQLYVIFKSLVYSLQNCLFQCDLMTDTYCIIIDKKRLLYVSFHIIPRIRESRADVGVEG